jgi:hypothetical protein
MSTSKSKHARMKQWSRDGDHLPAKAKRGRSLKGAERAAVIERLKDSKRKKAEVARKVAVASVKVERRIAQRLEGLDGSISHSPRGLSDTLAESDQRNQLAARIASRRAENSERKFRQQEDRAAHMDTACQRAWDNRLRVEQIIVREMSSRQDGWEDDIDSLRTIVGP